MTADGFVPGILSDIAASLFAVLLLVLMLVLGHNISAHRRGPAGIVPDQVIAERDLRAIERQVESPSDMIEQLRRRLLGPGDRPLIIELHHDGIEVLPPEVPDARALASGADLVPELQRIVLQVPARSEVALFVFGGELYEPVRSIVAAAGHPARELSVPEALRCRRADGGDDEWCAAFLALGRDAERPAAFRAALARLLAGGVGAASNAAGAFRDEPSERLAVGLSTRLGQWWRRIFMALTWPSLCVASWR
jgi:hypothetical protein